MTLSIDIYNQSWVKQATLFEVEYLSLKENFNEIEQSTLKIKRGTKWSEHLLLDRYLIVNDTRHPSDRYGQYTYIIREIITDVNENTLEFALFPLKHILSQRVTKPLDKDWENTNTQTSIMNRLVTDNCINDPDGNSSRQIPNLMTQNPIGGGGATQTVYYDSKWSILSEALTDIAYMSDRPLGWFVQPSMTSGKPNGNMNFYVKVPDDRSNNNTQSNKPVVFSDMKNDFSESRFIESKKGFANASYGKGKRMLQVELDDTQDGLNRFEANIQSQLGGINAQENDIKAELRRRAATSSFEVEIAQTSEMVQLYNRTWFIGDIVNVTSSQLGVFKDQQVMSVEQVYEGEVYELHIEFNDIRTGLNKILKEQIRDLRAKREYDKIQGKLIWEGALLMADTHTIDVTQTNHGGDENKLSETKKGWVLVWSEYVGGSGGSDSNWYTTYVPNKVPTDRGIQYRIPYTNYKDTSKFLKYTDKTITGYAKNIDSTNNVGSTSICLREVRIW